MEADLPSQLADVPLAVSDKQTKLEANYREATDDGRKCANCIFFDNSCCDLVAGSIQRDFISDLYQPARFPSDSSSSVVADSDSGDGSD